MSYGFWQVYHVIHGSKFKLYKLDPKASQLRKFLLRVVCIWKSASGTWSNLVIGHQSYAKQPTYGETSRLQMIVIEKIEKSYATTVVAFQSSI